MQIISFHCVYDKSHLSGIEFGGHLICIPREGSLSQQNRYLHTLEKISIFHKLCIKGITAMSM